MIVHVRSIDAVSAAAVLSNTAGRHEDDAGIFGVHLYIYSTTCRDRNSRVLVSRALRQFQRTRANERARTRRRARTSTRGDTSSICSIDLYLP